MIQLSNIRPDWEDLRTQLQNELLTKDSWKDRITGSTGQTLIDFIAAVGAYSQYSIESAYQEVWPESAKNARSLYAASNFLGVRVNRKNPASVTVSITSPVLLQIPINTQFTGAGTYWFNRSVLTLGPTPTTITLYQGRVIRYALNGVNTNFQAFVSTEKDFVVSDTDVSVSMNTVSIPTIQQGLWTRPGLPGCQQFTQPDGRLIILFGNANYGTRPTASDSLLITYVVTMGEDGNNVSTLNKTFVMDGNPSVTGTASVQASGGGSETNPLTYKTVSPALYGSFDASVTALQYKRLPLQYPGVKDAKVYSQREVNPNSLSWMNLIKVSLLTDSIWNTTQWRDFETWYQERTMFSTRVFREDPVAVPVPITANVYCTNLSNLGNVNTRITSALTDLFAPRQGLIGMDLYRSDIISRIMNADSNVEYVELEAPADDVVLTAKNVETPSLNLTNPGGTLAPGQYSYAVSVVSSFGGETAPANWATTTNPTAGSSVQITWQAVPNVVNYKVWGRSSGAYGLLATVASNVLTFTDTGAAVPGAVPPTQSTVDISYPTLGAVNLNLRYSLRERVL